MNLIAHRGCWFKPEEKNTLVSFLAALNNGFGIETDIRDYKGELVISHDIATEQSPLFKDFVCLLKQYNAKNIALNIKSDGLHDLFCNEIKGIDDFFVFDMSIPDAVGYIKRDVKFYTRYSNYELTPSLLNDAKGVWLDNFLDSKLDGSQLFSFLAKCKDVSLVSPELHGFKYEGYWEELRQFLNENPMYDNKISLCTDYPLLAKEFFKGEK